MKKILIALAMTGFTYFSAEAQGTDGKKTCGVTQDEVCRKGHGCYKTKYAENFKVCKSNKGYSICCEAVNYSNSTHPLFVVGTEENTYDPNNYMQNYTRNDYYEGYYQQKSKIKSSCYTGNNVAELNRAPYKGCPSPQSDGPERNNERNVNVVNLPEGQ